MKTNRIIMLVGVISLLILVPIDLLTDSARPLNIIIPLISLALGILTLRTMFDDKRNKRQ